MPAAGDPGGVRRRRERDAVGTSNIDVPRERVRDRDDNDPFGPAEVDRARPGEAGSRNAAGRRHEVQPRGVGAVAQSQRVVVEVDSLGGPQAERLMLADKVGAVVWSTTSVAVDVVRSVLVYKAASA